MTGELVTETETPSADVHTMHTVITDDCARSSGGTPWAEAANSVSEAAGQVGAAAQDAGSAARGAVDGK